MSGNEPKLVRLRGRVELAAMGGLSKSSHRGFVLVYGKKKIKLRREGGNPFYDPFFETYLKKKVSILAYDMESYLLVKEIQQEEDPGGGKSL